ncbi:MAG: hypothetical protein AB8A46_07525 [Prochlorococcus sp.]|nr:MAG: Uncharacterised protein [Prochlorococcus marinus str. MIT 9215]
MGGACFDGDEVGLERFNRPLWRVDLQTLETARLGYGSSPFAEA